jgi:hypothetical protein
MQLIINTLAANPLSLLNALLAVTYGFAFAQGKATEPRSITRCYLVVAFLHTLIGIYHAAR